MRPSFFFFSLYFLCFSLFVSFSTASYVPNIWTAVTHSGNANPKITKMNCVIFLFMYHCVLICEYILSLVNIAFEPFTVGNKNTNCTLCKSSIHWNNTNLSNTLLLVRMYTYMHTCNGVSERIHSKSLLQHKSIHVYISLGTRDSDTSAVIVRDLVRK